MTVSVALSRRIEEKRRWIVDSILRSKKLETLYFRPAAGCQLSYWDLLSWDYHDGTGELGLIS